MANDTTSERLWSFTTATGGNIAAAGTEVIIRKVVLIPAAVSEAVTIQEYDSAGSARSAIVLKVSTTVVEMTELDFGPNGRRLNGFNLSAITAGGVLYVYLGRD